MLLKSVTHPRFLYTCALYTHLLREAASPLCTELPAAFLIRPLTAESSPGRDPILDIRVDGARIHTHTHTYTQTHNTHIFVCICIHYIYIYKNPLAP